MNFLSIKNRVFLLALLPTLIISFILGAYLVYSRITDIEDEQRLVGMAILSQIVHISRESIFQQDKQSLRDIINVFPEDRDLEGITFFDKNHQILAYGGQDENQEDVKKITFSNDTPTSFENKDTITLTIPVVVSDLKIYPNINFKHNNANPTHKEVIGWVAVTLSRTHAILQEYQVITLTLLLFIFGIGISSYFARRTSQYLTFPILRIRSVIRKITQGDYVVRIPPRSGDSGFQELEEDVNTMAKALQQSQELLQENINQTTENLKKSLATVETQNGELARAQKEVLESGRIKSEFIANMSHEIRTPMNSIIGFTNLLLETELIPLQRNYLSTIQRSTLNLLNIINNVLDFSRLDAGHLKLEHIPFDLRDCVEDVLTIMSPLANNKSLEFTALIDPAIPKKIISDPLRIKQIIINFISNAIKFTEQGEIVIRVSLEKQTNKSVKIRINVSDTGVGLANDQKNIFNAFQQGDPSIARKYGGTGLGLAICKKLVDTMAGKIGFERSADRGTTFWFSFTAETTQYQSPNEIDTVNFNGTRAVICENHPISREALKNALNEWEIKNDDFVELNELILQLQNPDFNHPKIDFIILGINQQQLPTQEFLTLREIFKGPIIVLINSSEQAVLESFIKKGAIFSLTKPLIRRNLYHAIFQIIHPKENHKQTLVQTVAVNDAEQTHNFSGKSILCVDDNIHNANLVKALLDATHATVIIAHDGLEALNYSLQRKFDLILMDLRMPRMDGYDALRSIRDQQNPNALTPAIALSAHILEDEHETLTQLGFNGYILKPINKNHLLEIVKGAILLGDKFKTFEVLSEPKKLNNNDLTIDWELGTKLAGNKREVAEEMLNLLVKNLPTEIQQMKNALQQHNLKLLLQQIHKFHGALCYCGVPRLKTIAAELETHLKQNKTHTIHQLFTLLETEASKVLEVVSEI